MPGRRNDPAPFGKVPCGAVSMSHAPGGISCATVLACMFFGASSGSGPATAAALGMLMIPAMMNRGYDKGYASAITASSGGLGVVIPPPSPW